MTYFTFEDIEKRVRRELDLIDEPLVTQQELMSYCNQAIDVAEAEIHSLYEDYFLKKGTINLVAGQSEYDLPSDIYASKIRAVIYNVGGEIYEVARMNDRRMFESIKRSESLDSNLLHRYILTNPSPSSGVKLFIFPAAKVTATGGLTVWYLRNANRVSAVTDVVDIPEFSNFIVAKMKWLVAVNKPGIASVEGAAKDAETQYELMQVSLKNRTPDDWTQVVMDTDIYFEHT